MQRYLLALTSACASLVVTFCGNVPPSASTGAAEPPVHESRVYVTNEVSGDLSLIDPDTNRVVATVPLGKRPRGMQVSFDRTLLYVSLSGSPIAGPGVDPSTLPPVERQADGIGVVDLDELELTRVIRGGSDPQQFVLSRDGTRLYVPNEELATTEVWDVASGRVLASLPVGQEPEGAGASLDGLLVYVTSEQDSQVTAIDTQTDRVVKSFPVGLRPRGVAFAPDGTRAYVTGENDASVSVVDTSTHDVVRTITLEGENVRPMGVVVSPDGRHLYVTTGRGGTVVVIDATTGEAVASIEVGARPWGVALTPDGRTLYTANGPSNDVSVVDVTARAVVATIPVGERPWGVAFVP